MKLGRRETYRLASRITETLREYIGSMPEGTKLLPEPELAGELGVSRTTLRTALATLEDEGIVERAPRRGTIVRRPRRGRPATMGVISPLTGWERAGSFYGEVYRGITAAAARAEVDVTHLLGSLGRDITPAAIRGLTWERFDALVVFELFDDRCLEVFQERAREVMVLDNDATSFGLSSVVFDNLGAAAALTDAFMDMGHKRFGFIGPRLGGRPWNDPALVERLRGVMDAVSRRQGVFLAQHVLAADGRDKDDEETLRPFLSSPPESRPTAIIAANRGYASVFLRMAERGLFKVPQDVSLAIFGAQGSPDAEECAGAYFNGYEMGYNGADMLCRQIREDSEPGALHREGFRLELHTTVAPPAGK